MAEPLLTPGGSRRDDGPAEEGPISVTPSDGDQGGETKVSFSVCADQGFSLRRDRAMRRSTR